MTETKRTNFFALLFFCYFIAISLAASTIPGLAQLSDSSYMILMQLLSFLPPLLLYFFFTKKDVKKTLRLRPLGWKNILLLLSFGISIQPIMSLLSYVTSLFFPNPVSESVGGIQSSGFFPSLIAVAILPPLLEEAFSRGILLSGYTFLGKWRAAFASALLFGLLHLNPQQFPYAFLVGFVFCFLVERTGSLWASILPHIIINGTTIFSIFSQTAADTTAAVEAAVEMSPFSILVSLSLMAVLSLPWLAVLLYLLLKVNPPEAELPLSDETGAPYRERFLTPSLLLLLVLYVLFGLLPYLVL